MKHPNREQWIGFLYEDCDPAEKTELTEHLKSCASCQEQLNQWRQTATALNQYAVAPTSHSLWERTGVKSLRRSWLPLSAAAAVLLACGITIGTTLQSRANPANSRAVAELRDRLQKSEAENARTQKLLIELSQTMADNQAALVLVAQQVQATRKDLETVTLLTDANFKNVARFASYNP